MKLSDDFLYFLGIHTFIKKKKISILPHSILLENLNNSLAEFIDLIENNHKTVRMRFSPMERT